jgi:hypothetical protein
MDAKTEVRGTNTEDAGCEYGLLVSWVKTFHPRNLEKCQDCEEFMKVCAGKSQVKVSFS